MKSVVEVRLDSEPGVGPDYRMVAVRRPSFGIAPTWRRQSIRLPRVRRSTMPSRIICATAFDLATTSGSGNSRTGGTAGRRAEDAPGDLEDLALADRWSGR